MGGPSRGEDPINPRIERTLGRRSVYPGGRRRTQAGSADEPSDLDLYELLGALQQGLAKVVAKGHAVPSLIMIRPFL